MKKATLRITLTMRRGPQGIGLDLTITIRQSDSTFLHTILGTGDITDGTPMIHFGVEHTTLRFMPGGIHTGIHRGIRSILITVTTDTDMPVGDPEEQREPLAQRVVAVM